MHMSSCVCAVYTLLMWTHIPAGAHNNTDHLGALLAYQTDLSSRISQWLMNIRWERIIPQQSRPTPTKASEAADSAVKRCPLRPLRLLKDSLAVVSMMLYNCGWISCNTERERKCVHVRVCLSPYLYGREKERGMTKSGIHLHLSP